MNPDAVNNDAADAPDAVSTTIGVGVVKPLIGCCVGLFQASYERVHLPLVRLALDDQQGVSVIHSAQGW